jgi:hypothetical protein
MQSYGSQPDMALAEMERLKRTLPILESSEQCVFVCSIMSYRARPTLLPLPQPLQPLDTITNPFLPPQITPKTQQRDSLGSKTQQRDPGNFKENSLEIVRQGPKQRLAKCGSPRGWMDSSHSGQISKKNLRPIGTRGQVSAFTGSMLQDHEALGWTMLYLPPSLCSMLEILMSACPHGCCPGNGCRPNSVTWCYKRCDVSRTRCE